MIPADPSTLKEDTPVPTRATLLFFVENSGLCRGRRKPSTPFSSLGPPPLEHEGHCGPFGQMVFAIPRFPGERVVRNSYGSLEALRWHANTWKDGCHDDACDAHDASWDA